ncbi:MAG: tRNA lysidine(34) synthetase TilS [Acholeplasmataceae bacterium]
MSKVSLKHSLTKYLSDLNGEPLVLSVSGGMDSMALLDMAISFQPHVVHFNHQVRKDSDADVQLVKQFCEKHQLSYDVFYLNVPKSNFQHEAHIMRQKKLIQVAENRKIKHVFTAHHAGDQTETILMRLIRGSDLHGYSGLNEKEVLYGITFHKPLLSISKTSIAEYIQEHHVPYREDTSNATNDYFRNRIRHQIIPLLKQENPRLNDSFTRFHEQLSVASSHLDDEATRYDINNLTRTQFIQLSPALQIQLLIKLLRLNQIDYNYEHIKSIQSLIASSTSNAELHLSNQKRFVLNYEEFFIREAKELSNSVVELKEGLNEIDGKKISIFFDNNSRFQDSNTKICYNISALPLVVRHRVEGDQLAFSFGHKKLKDYLIDKKIPKHLRDELLIVVDQNNIILYVENIYTNKTFQSDHTVSVDVKGVSDAQ